MKKNIIFSFGIAIIITACGTPQDSEEKIALADKTKALQLAESQVAKLHRELRDTQEGVDQEKKRANKIQQSLDDAERKIGYLERDLKSSESTLDLEKRRALSMLESIGNKAIRLKEELEMKLEAAEEARDNALKELEALKRPKNRN